ncbi:helix-turn-helix transcriptional regulator [Pseudomonas sp. No.21]|jgi:transcriptional regulator with XRE-family HTH domain|uniref:helix-turn-helix domain-containing protein n=1 Tax=Pseudomonas TaxID=286 RepID=UPI000DA8FF5C|nr:MULTISPECIES: helix-turn-helix transcriptional regulator [Pseudomonas]MDW3714551.1 helix-turn-helix transcriptional regulator [Pseudomonas sp. 2023EL-01195]PZE14479.1 XRE family transcriptional regulator [Pseudomonas sp. 57B-090624]GJN50134.1 transcriptional regulator [Pseudomonas tohonis]
MKTINSPPYQRLLELLIATRNESGMTQQQLSEKLLRPQSYVSKYERGERRLDVVEFLLVVQSLGAEPFALLREIQPLLKQLGRNPKNNVGDDQ